MPCTKTDGGAHAVRPGGEASAPPKITFRKLGDLCDFTKGETGIAKAKPGKYPLVVTAAERKTCNTYQFDTEAVCIPLVSSAGHGKKKLNHVHYQTGKFALGTILVAVVPKDGNVLSTRFLHLYLSHLKDLILVPLMRGAANVSLSVSAIKGIEIPLPSIGEQEAIVSGFENIDTEQQEPIDEITEQEALLKKLRQSILQDAIQGKLTADWRKAHPGTEPAADLLQRIQAEKQKLSAEKKIRKQKPLPPINPDEIPFDLPEGWEWCQLGDMFQFIDYRGRTPKKSPSGKRLITAKNIKMGYIDENPVEYMSEEDYEKWMVRGFPASGDILFVTEGHTMGSVSTIDKASPFATAQRTIIFKGFLTDPFGFAVSFIMSDYFQELLKEKASGSATMGVKASILKTLILPLPPLAEQAAIVEKVGELFGWCDELERQIARSKQDASALMQSVLADAFAQPAS